MEAVNLTFVGCLINYDVVFDTCLDRRSVQFCQYPSSSRNVELNILLWPVYGSGKAGLGLAGLHVISAIAT